MLELYRLAQDEGADRLEDALQELAAAHRVIICTDSGALGPGLTPHHPRRGSTEAAPGGDSQNAGALAPFPV